MASDEALRRLSTLSPREREVLALQCEGLTYKEIGGRLYLSESTIKTYMGRIYVKLGLDQLKPKSRAKMLDDVFCPALTSTSQAAIPPQLEPPQPEPDSVPEEVRQMVEEDEKMLVLYRRPQSPAVVYHPDRVERVQPPIVISQGPPGPVWRWRFLVGGIAVGTLLGMLAMAGIFWVLGGFSSGDATTPTTQVTSGPTQTPVTQQATVVQLVTVVVSPTAEPVTSTDTLISPAPSDTPIPTVTPIPTSTPIPDTPAGSILEVGQTWRQGGVALTLSDFVLHPARDDFYGQLYVGWRFANNMPTEIILSISPNNFSAKDNFGNSLKILSFYNESFWCDGHTVVVNASESFDFLDMCGPGSSGYRLPIVVNLANPQLSEVIVIASGISRIEGAQWRIPFVH